MNRFRVASDKFSSARRHLITTHAEGERGALLAALRDVEEGLDALGDSTLVSGAAVRSVELLQSLVPMLRRPTDASFEWGKFASAVDELATWLYWNEPTAA